MSHLTREQMEEFREPLLTAKAYIEESLQQSAGERPVETSGPTIGRLSRMDAMQMQAMAQMGRRQLETRLQRIDVALEALDAGTYGVCRECKEMIGMKRLEAMPESLFCMPCQESFE